MIKITIYSDPLCYTVIATIYKPVEHASSVIERLKKWNVSHYIESEVVK